MRLDKYLAGCGSWSRKEIKKQIKQGAVFVDGKPAQDPQQQVESGSAVVLNGQPMQYREFIYLMLHKPEGYVSATEDKKLPFVTQLVPEEYRHFEPFPVGRLDIDTEGLLLLTNDGAFAHQITSPKKKLYKKYFARLDRPAEQKDIAVFEQGIELKDFTAQPAVLEIGQDPTEVFISVCEGKYHQVKRMCHFVGKEVLYLKRVSIGNVVLDADLKKGEMRELTEQEYKALVPERKEDQ